MRSIKCISLKCLVFLLPHTALQPPSPEDPDPLLAVSVQHLPARLQPEDSLQEAVTERVPSTAGDKGLPQPGTRDTEQAQSMKAMKDTGGKTIASTLPTIRIYCFLF